MRAGDGKHGPQVAGGVRPERWCILTTSPGATLRLVESLGDAGFEAWTPATFEHRSYRRIRKREVVKVPMMPGWAFAAAEQLYALVALLRSPLCHLHQIYDSGAGKFITKGHPRFSIFRFDGEYPLLRDRLLDPLRAAELRQPPVGAAPQFNPGQTVRMSEGGFAGLDGTVERMSGRYAIVKFAGWPVAVKIPAWVLSPHLDAESRAPVSGRKVG